ncbi:MAG TPA: hypothetical protein DEO33_05270 [Rikenellaceae bacterium]|nr:hypothetical protein [Rikenellaceae bacterium]
MSEAEQHWWLFQEDLTDRGLEKVQSIVSNDHYGLRKARSAVFTGVQWQRCQFHMQQNANQHIPQ